MIVEIGASPGASKEAETRRNQECQGVANSQLALAIKQERDKPMRNEVTGKLMVMALLLCCSACLAQSKPIDPDARRQIDAGNQQWVDAMKQGNVALLVPGNTADAVDCSPEGDCIRGRSALEGHMKEEMAKSGKADSASVLSIGSVQQGRYVYEWGEAKAHFPNGKSILDRYLTVWQKQPDGTWKLFRNLVIPNR
jgi:ketosteroid isomerase-like protein